MMNTIFEISFEFDKKQEDNSVKILEENIENQNFTDTGSTNVSFNFLEEFIKKKRERNKKRKKRKLLIETVKIIKIDDMREKINKK